MSVVYSSRFLESQKRLKCLCFLFLLKSHPSFPLVPISPGPSGRLQGVGLAVAMPVFLLLGIPSTVNPRGQPFTGALWISPAYRFTGLPTTNGLVPSSRVPVSPPCSSVRTVKVGKSVALRTQEPLNNLPKIFVQRLTRTGCLLRLAFMNPDSTSAE